MKKLYCLIFLLIMPSMYGMQKKNKSHKKFNIHNVQKKNGKKSGSVAAKKKQLKKELYQLEMASSIKQRKLDKLTWGRDDYILASLVLGSPVLLYTFVTLDHYARGVSCSNVLNWCIDKTYSNAPF